VRTVGAEGAVLTRAYRGVLEINPHRISGGPTSGAATTVFTTNPVFHRTGPYPLRVSGVGGGTVRSAGGRFEVEVPTRRPWELRTTQTLSIDDHGPALDATLRQVGTSTFTARLTGTVTNRGPVPIRSLRAQTENGQARVADIVNPGETLSVDAPVLTPIPGTAGQHLLPAVPEEAAMFAAAAGSFTRPGQVALVGLTGPPAAQGPVHRIAVTVAVAPLTGSEIIAPVVGSSRQVLYGTDPAGESVAVFDLAAPAGAGPLSVTTQSVIADIEHRRSRQSVEVYNWTDGTWRALPTTGQPRAYATFATPLSAAEVNNGLVRIRTPSDFPDGSQTFAYLTGTFGRTPS